MKTGPKNKAKNTPSKTVILQTQNDPIEGPLNPTNQVNPDVLPNVDGRKFVRKEDLSELEFEDRVWLYWQQNKLFIISLVVLVIAFAFGRLLWDKYQVEQTRKIDAQYLAAKTPSQLDSFIEKYASKAQGKSARIKLADMLFEEGKYAKALALYKKSLEDISSDTSYLKGKLLLAIAVSTYMLPDEKNGEELLKALSSDMSVLEAFRLSAISKLELIGKQSDKK